MPSVSFRICSKVKKNLTRIHVFHNEYTLVACNRQALVTGGMGKTERESERENFSLGWRLGKDWVQAHS